MVQSGGGFLPDLANYQTRTLGGTVRYTFEGGHVRGTVANTFNKPYDDGQILGSGLTALPSVPFVGLRPPVANVDIVFIVASTPSTTTFIALTATPDSRTLHLPPI